MSRPASTPAEPGRPPRLVLRFALYAGLALVLAALAGAWLVRGQALERARADAGSQAAFVADRLGRDDLARAALGAPATGDRLAELDDLFGREALGHGIERVTLVDREGVVTYSTEHALIGGPAPAGLDLAAVLGGETVHRVADTGAGRQLESAVPARWLLADPTWRSGAVVVARDYEPVARKMREDFLLQAGTLVAALLALYLALLPIMRATTAALAARNRRLREQAVALAASEERYRALTEEASDAIVVCDGETVVLEANEQAGELLGRPAAALVGVAFGELVQPEDLAATPLQLGELRAGRRVLLERRLRGPDGQDVLVELHAKLLEDGRILTIMRDVRERKRTEEALRRAEKAEASSRLAAGIAQDFDAVLATISMRARELGARAAGAGLDELVAAAARGAELTDQLHAFGSRTLGEEAGGAPLVAGGSETVLVVEDEEVVRAVVREILEEHGYAVLEARHGREALDLLPAVPRLDVLITDIVMPEMGGVELAEEVERLRPGVPVIYISGYSDDAVVSEVGGDPTFLQKPFTHEDLTRTLREVLDRGPSVPV